MRRPRKFAFVGRGDGQKAEALPAVKGFGKVVVRRIEDECRLIASFYGVVWDFFDFFRHTTPFAEDL